MARKISVQIVGDSSSLERSFRRSTAAATGFNRDLSRAGRGVLAVGVGYRSLARSVAFASSAFVGAAGLTAGLKASISGFSQFQESMQQAVGLAGVAQKQIGGFSKRILGLSTTVGKSPQELAKAFYFVASSGIAASKAMDVVTASAKASVAGLGETQVVADAVTSAMNAYGVANLSAQHATDVLVATVRAGKGEASDFAGVIGNVASLASQLGVSFNDVGAALAAETRLGIDAQTASVQLQQVFSNLVKVAPQAEKAFKSVGLSSAGLRKEFANKGLLAGLETIKTAFAGDLPALAKAFPNIRALRGVLALVGKQAASTAQIFKTMSNVTGSLKTAFDAVSNDSAQQFRKLRASAEVAGISIGAIFSPLAGKVADALAATANEFTSFLNRVNAQSAIRGKLNVVWEGAEGAAKGAASALAAGVAKIDWNRVWASARGIADGLQARLEAIDWGKIGRGIGDGLARAVKTAIPAAKEIAVKIGDIVGAIDWTKLGRKAGPGLAAAIVTAFTTLTDPVFWVKNWDLALAVALTVFGGSVGKVAGKLGAVLVRPLARIGGDAALALAGGLERLATGIVGPIEFAFRTAGAVAARGAARLGELTLTALLKLPRLIGRALGGLIGPVKALFDRLGGFAKFTVKVFGIKIAIDAVAGLVKQVGELIGHGFEKAFEELKRQAIKTALAMVEPFSHLPAFLGGWARKAKDALQAQLDGMVKSSQAAGAAIQNALAGVTSTGSAAAETAASPNRAQAQTTPTAIPKAAQKRLTDSVQTATKTASTAATAAVAKGFTLPFQLQLAQAKAAATQATGDDLRVAKQIRAFVLKAIPHLGGQKLLDAYQELGQVNSQLAGAVQTAANKVKGFAVPLALQVAQARDAALGKDSALKRVLEKIKAVALKALKSGKLGFQGQLDAWNAIASVNDQLKNQVRKAATKFKHVNVGKIVAGLDSLSRSDALRLRQQLAQVGAGGTIPSGRTPAFAGAGGGGGITFNAPVHFHGVQNVKQMEDELQKRARQRPAPRRR